MPAHTASVDHERASTVCLTTRRCPRHRRDVRRACASSPAAPPERRSALSRGATLRAAGASPPSVRRACTPHRRRRATRRRPEQRAAPTPDGRGVDASAHCSVDHERASTACLVIRRCPPHRRDVRRVTDASRIAPPPMATGIPALFVPRRESGHRTSRRAASPPPRPSSLRFRLTCASTSVVASATAGMLVARLVQPCCASAEPGDADRRAEDSLTVHQRVARRCIFVKSRLPDAVDARDGKEQRPRRAASNAAGASGVAGVPFSAELPLTNFRITFPRAFPPSVPSTSVDSLAHRASANAQGCEVAT